MRVVMVEINSGKILLFRTEGSLDNETVVMDSPRILHLIPSNQRGLSAGNNRQQHSISIAFEMYLLKALTRQSIVAFSTEDDIPKEILNGYLSSITGLSIGS